MLEPRVLPAQPSATMRLMPVIIPSSSQGIRSRMIPGNSGLSFAIVSRTTTAQARPPFMSALPRPYRIPSSISPENGSRDQFSCGPSKTTSVWPSSNNVLPEPRPVHSAITFSLNGATSVTCTAKPAFSRRSARKRATFCSCGRPGAATESMRTNVCARRTTSSSGTAWAILWASVCASWCFMSPREQKTGIGNRLRLHYSAEQRTWFFVQCELFTIT